MTTKEAIEILRKYSKDVIDQDERVRNAGIKPEKLAFFEEDKEFVEAVKKVIKKLNEEEKKKLVLRRQRDDARKSVKEACRNALYWMDKWAIAANTIDRAKKQIEEDMAHSNQFNCGDYQLILDILEEADENGRKN